MCIKGVLYLTNNNNSLECTEIGIVLPLVKAHLICDTCKKKIGLIETTIIPYNKIICLDCGKV